MRAVEPRAQETERRPGVRTDSFRDFARMSTIGRSRATRRSSVSGRSAGQIVAELAVFLVLPPAIVALERWHGIQLPGPLLVLVIVAATYRYNFWLGALLAVEGIGLLRAFGRPFTMHFGWLMVSLWTVFLVIAAFLVDRVVARERRARERVEASEARFVGVFAGAQVGLIVIDTDRGVVESVNSSLCEISGYPAQEIVGRNPAFLMDEQRFPVLQTPELAKLVRGELASVHTDGVMVRPDGERAFVDIAAVVVAGDDGRPRLAGTIIDRTAHLRAEEQARRAQRLDAVGRLAGGIAHDFNNLLTVISGYSRLVLDDRPPARIERDVSSIEEAAGRAADLTRELLAFSRKAVVRPRLLDLNTVISRIDRMFRRLIEAQIEIETDLALGEVHVVADETQIEQLLMNLIINARDAMPTGGALTISTRPVRLEDSGRGARLLAARSGEYAAVTVTDTGVGMLPETLERIFDPFFTTKGDGGTGLGLATVYGIVEQAHGDLEVRSIAGVGTTFIVYLPLATDSAPAIEVVSPPADARSRTSEAKILVVEDEPRVRELVTTILRSAGHTVQAASTAEEALEQLNRGLIIDVLLTDVGLPSQSGLELAVQVVRQLPGVAVVYMSGYADKPMPHDAKLVTKPFGAADLVATIDNAISEAHVAAAPSLSR
jgi:two-component system cell cycle sensor histidine kinase/response regulator CckA